MTNKMQPFASACLLECMQIAVYACHLPVVAWLRLCCCTACQHSSRHRCWAALSRRPRHSIHVVICSNSMHPAAAVLVAAGSRECSCSCCRSSRRSRHGVVLLLLQVEVCHVRCQTGVCGGCSINVGRWAGWCCCCGWADGLGFCPVQRDRLHTNKAGARHFKWFVSYHRPGVGQVCWQQHLCRVLQGAIASEHGK